MNVKKFSALIFFYWGRKSLGVILQHAQKRFEGGQVTHILIRLQKLNPNMVESFIWDVQVSNYKQTKYSINDIFMTFR